MLGKFKLKQVTFTSYDYTKLHTALSLYDPLIEVARSVIYTSEGKKLNNEEESLLEKAINIIRIHESFVKNS